MTGEYGDGCGRTGDGELTWQVRDEALTRASGASTYTTRSTYHMINMINYGKCNLNLGITDGNIAR